jgi:hypothetical protein
MIRSHTEMIKLGRFLKSHGVSTDYPVKLTVLNFGNYDLIMIDQIFEENSDIYF